MENYTMINNIYHNYANNHGDYDLQETKKAKQTIDDYVVTIGLPKNQKEELENCIVSVICEYERQGFLMGFSAGLELASQVKDILQKGKD